MMELISPLSADQLQLNYERRAGLTKPNIFPQFQENIFFLFPDSASKRTILLQQQEGIMNCKKSQKLVLRCTMMGLIAALSADQLQLNKKEEPG